jgi:hypothetical protein
LSKESRLLYTEFEVLDKIPLTKGTKLTFNKNENYQLVTGPNGPEIVVTKYKVHTPPTHIPTEEELKAKKQQEVLEHELEEEQKEFREFQKKWQIKCGSYYLHPEKGMISIAPEDEEYFETQTSKKLLELFRGFIKNQHKMIKYKKMKRSYLLHSLPGMGKSALIRYFCREALKTPGTAILKVGGEIDFQILQHLFLMNYAADVERIVLVIEDFGKKDYAANSNIYNPSCLNFLDGNVQLFRVPTLIITTTNFAKELGIQLTNRPGRFSKIVHVAPPTDEEIFELSKGYLSRELTEEERAHFRGKNFTPDHCLEAVMRSEIEEITIQQAIDDIIKERENIVDWGSY